MQPFVRETGVVAPLDRVDVDTDQIIPKQFLKRIERTGFGQFLFYDWRFREDGSPDPAFELNQPAYQGASILVSGRNFGCGSSREHAPWALQDYGIRAVIAPSFADIFFNNCFKNGMLPVVLSEETVDELLARAKERPGYRVTVDLESQTVGDEEGVVARFEVDPFRRHLLLNGLDDIGLSLQHEAEIAKHEARMPDRFRGLTTTRAV
ncbi:MAG TPA: 3-isopropylmalate dehydratase small subunit [Chloroflexota bacterium]|jgi:3-isopropylmalate/(R)-2-methylmalate dehydratase small subunit|nr:3-isopropylmalate dehydratase small subunit [Chloroflexota bacterium]